MSDWSSAAAAGRRGRRALLFVGAAIVGVLVLCVGFAPAILRGVLFRGSPDGDGYAALQGCGLPDLPGLPGVAGLDPKQLANAAAVVGVGRELKVPPRGWVIALATAAQESRLRNLANPKVPESMALPHDGEGTDHDSVGMFQQRPSWGAPAQLLDPRYASAKFYDRLLRVRGWERMRLTDAAQKVQSSAFPGAYQKWEQLATLLAAKLAGEAFAAVGGAPLCATVGQVSAAGWTVPAHGALGSGFRTQSRPGHDGVDLSAARGSPIWAAASGIVITVICQSSSGSCDTDGSPAVRGCGWYVEVAHGAGIWTRYCHLAQRPVVIVGQRVEAGQPLGIVGSSGNSSGPHLHFEVHDRNKAVDPVRYMSGRGAPLDQSS